MTTDNIINLVSAIIVGGGTLFLGIMAWKSIRQTRTIQESGQKEKLLNEIIEWAENIKTCGIVPAIELFRTYQATKVFVDDESELETKSKSEKEAETKHREQLLTHILMYSTKNNYMSIIAPKINKELGAVMTEVVSGLDKQLGLLRKALIDVEHTSTTDISLEMEKLTESATKLIEEATKIKTRDIG